MYKRVLVTGGAGFVGSSLAIFLRQHFEGARVVAFDNLRRRGSELNLPRLKDHGVQFVHGDIRAASDFESLPEIPDLILECSAEPSVQAGYTSSPEYLIETNLIGCYRCLELARRTKADVVFISTSRVYPVQTLNSLAYREDETRFTLLDEQSVPGASAQGISEDFPLDGARSLYGTTKLAGELLIAEYADAFGFRFVIDRCGLIAGPWQMGKSDQGVITLWVAAHLFGFPLNYIGFGGQGKQVRDVLHIHDLCDLVALQIGDMNRFSGKTFNAGGGLDASASLRELTELCRQETGKNIAIGAVAENRRADLISYITDSRRLSDYSGWRPQRKVHRTVRDIADWIGSNQALVRNVLAIS